MNCAAIPGVSFPLRPDRKLALASWRLGLPSVRLEVKRELRKIFLLVISFVENHDAFTECGLVKVTCKVRPDEPPFDATEEPVGWTRTRYEESVLVRSLTTPGDLDSFLPEYYAGPQATARQERATRYGLLSRLNAQHADWPEGIPLASPYGLLALLGPPPRDGRPEGEFRSFPQPQYWASCPCIRTKSATFNVVQIDLGKSRHVLSIELESPLQDAALGVVSVVGIGPE